MTRDFRNLFFSHQSTSPGPLTYGLKPLRIRNADENGDLFDRCGNDNTVTTSGPKLTHRISVLLDIVKDNLHTNNFFYWISIWRQSKGVIDHAVPSKAESLITLTAVQRFIKKNWF
jgi:hypothetical protein